MVRRGREGSSVSSVLTVLIVDDEPDMRLLAKAVLEAAGLQVVGEATDGSEAVLRYRELNPPPMPTVVLLDNRMPGMTGLEVATQVLSEAPDQLIVLFSDFLSLDPWSRGGG